MPICAVGTLSGGRRIVGRTRTSLWCSIQSRTRPPLEVFRTPTQPVRVVPVSKLPCPRIFRRGWSRYCGSSGQTRLSLESPREEKQDAEEREKVLSGQPA